MTVNSEFAQRIKELRQADNLTQKEFASRVGISAPSIVRWESGTAQPSLDALQHICDAFPAISVDWLLLGQGEMWKESTFTLSREIQETLNTAGRLHDAALTGFEQKGVNIQSLFGAAVATKVAADDLGLKSIGRVIETLTSLLGPFAAQGGKSLMSGGTVKDLKGFLESVDPATPPWPDRGAPEEPRKPTRSKPKAKGNK